MAPRPFRFQGHTAHTLTLALTVAACAGGGSEGSNGAGGTSSAGHSAAGNANGGGQAGQGVAGSGGGAAAGALGGSSSGGMTGGAPNGGAQAGGAAGATGATAGAGASAGGAAGSGGAPNVVCTRELLDGLLDAYFAALSAGDPSTLPLAADVRFTENAQDGELGKTAFWMNAGDTKYSQRALDTEQCGAAAQAVVPEAGTDRPVGLRLQARDGKLTEVETIVVRPGDYSASFAVESNPSKIISIAPSIGWDEEVPVAERATRQELSGWVDKYFRAFPAGVCNVTSACRRLENGGGDFSCGTGASCSASTPTTGGTFEPRIIVVDEVRGIAAGFTIFDFQTTGHLDMHMIKMSGGQVHAVHAILRNTNGESGWD